MDEPSGKESRVRVETANEGSYRGDGVSLRLILDERKGKRAHQHKPFSLLAGTLRGLGYISLLAVPTFTLALFAGRFDYRLLLAGGLAAFLMYATYRLTLPLVHWLEMWSGERVRHDTASLGIRPDELILGDGRSLSRQNIPKVRVVPTSLESVDVIATKGDSAEEHVLFASVPITDVDALTTALRRGGLVVEED
ncbi:MAG: hypothetical protein AB8H86_26245 [Polyangiales bacterium]